MEFSPFTKLPQGAAAEERKSLAETSFGYQWGGCDIRLREGDNGHIGPARLQIPLEQPMTMIQAGTYAFQDTPVRAKAAILFPTVERRSNLLFAGASLGRDIAGASLGWDIQTLETEADVSVTSLFDLRGMPYAAGMTGGVRYCRSDWLARRTNRRSDTFDFRTHTIIPYMGVFYAHSDLLGSLIRLEALFSHAVFTRMDATEKLGPFRADIDITSVTGQMFETLFQWSAPVSEGVYLGASGRFTFLDPSASARVEASYDSVGSVGKVVSSYSADMRRLLFFTGITLDVVF
jgi:hypothetical protein